MPYDLVTRVLDVNRDVVSFAQRPVTITTTRRLNEASEVTLTVPREHADALRTGAFVQRVRVHDDGTSEVVGTGRIGRRDVNQDGTLTFSAFLDAILLANNVTPANYTNALRNLLLEDLALTVIDGWRPLRADFATPVTSTSVDLVTEPGRVMLAKDASGHYFAAGSITVRFDADTVDAWKAWDRIRWESDYYDNVRTTVQYRSGATTGTLGAWSTEQQGADPAGAGIDLAGVTARFVDVRINLYTDDTETPAEVPEGEVATTFGFTPRVFGVEVVARTVGPVVVGSIDVADDVFVRTLEADASNALRLLQEACEATGHEFTVRNGALHVARELGEDRTNDVILQNGLNTEIVVLRDDDADLVNRLHAYGTGRGLSQPYAFVEDAASVALFGPYEATESFDVTTGAELVTAAGAWLAERAVPATQFEVNGPDAYALNLGDRVRIADPRSGTVVTTRVTEVTETESAEGRSVALILGQPPKSLVQQVIDRAEEDKRREYDLPLLPPSIRATGSHPGLQVAVGHAPRSRGVGFVVHFSGVRGFEPSTATERARGRQSLFEFPDVQPGTVYYVRAASFDRAGDVSGYTEEHPVRAAYVDPVHLDPGVQEALDDAAAVTGVVNQTIDVLNRAPDDAEQFSSIRTNADEVSSVVAVLNDVASGDPSQYTAFRQTAEEIAITAAKFDPWHFMTDAGELLVDENGNALVSGQASLADELGVNLAFSRISVQDDEIDLRVRYGEVVSSINLDPSGIRIRGEKIQLTGNTEIAGSFKVRGGTVEITGDTSIDGTLAVGDGANEVLIGNVGGQYGAPPGARGIAASLGSGLWLQGTPRVVAVTTVTDIVDAVVAWDPGGDATLVVTHDVPGFASFTVPAGKVWVVIPTVVRAYPSGRTSTTPVLSTTGLITGTLVYAYGSTLGGPDEDLTFPAGSHGDLRVWHQVRARNASGSTMTVGTLRSTVTVQIYELDADA